MNTSSTAPPEVALTLIVAMDAAGVIGADGGMPWHLPGDLRWFKQQTLNKPILMGRRTHDSIGRALPGRRNLVLTRNADFGAAGVERVADIDSAVAIARADHAPELMVIGGAEVFALTLARARTMQITRIEAHYPGDTWFPAVDWADWQRIAEQRVAATDTQPAHRFMTWQRR